MVGYFPLKWIENEKQPLSNCLDAFVVTLSSLKRHSVEKAMRAISRSPCIL